MKNIFIKRIALQGSASLQTINFNVENIEKELQEKNKHLRVNAKAINYTVEGNELIIYGEYYEHKEYPFIDVVFP